MIIMVKVVNDDCSTDITSNNRGRNRCMLVINCRWIDGLTKVFDTMMMVIVMAVDKL